MHDKRRWVLGAWLLALIGFSMVSGAVGDGFRSSFDLPNVESKQGFDVLDENFGGAGSGVSGTIVFRADQGVDDPKVKASMEDLFAKVAKAEAVDASSAPTPRRALGRSR